MAKSRCKECNREFAYTPSPKGGRPPSYCPDHRRGAGQPIDLAAARARRTEVRKGQKELERERTDRVEELSRAARLAVGLSGSDDPGIAALMVGLDVDAGELARLIELARRHYGELAAGRIEASAEHVRKALTLYVQRAIDTAHLVAPRDLPIAARNLAAVREALLGDNVPKHAFTTIEVVLIGPGGESVQLEPNKVSGETLGRA